MTKRPDSTSSSNCAGGVSVARPAFRRAGGGSTPTPALQVKNLEVKPIPYQIAKTIFEANHYLHSMPGACLICFGAFYRGQIAGAICFTRGNKEGYQLVDGAAPSDCATLARYWLNDDLPPNSESRVLGVVLRALRRFTSLKFLITYADLSRGHRGTIYMASNWTFTGLSVPMPLYDLGDGVERHSRSLSHVFGTHSMAYFRAKGIEVRKVPQNPKRRFLYFLDPRWRERLKVPALPYPREGLNDGTS